MIESARPAFPPARRFSEWLEWLVALFSEELAANPRRVATTLRLALIATIGTGLMAVCHVSGGLGPYLLWLLLGPVAMMSPRAALADLMLVGALLAASFPIAGALSETPWLVLAVIGAFTAAATYVVAVRKLGAIGLLGQVVTLNGFYGVIFEPRDFGWQVSSLFGATAIALALITLFDNWIWPDPAEAVLLESISAGTLRRRKLFLQAAAFYLGGGRLDRPKQPLPASDMLAQLNLLDRAVAEGTQPHRQAVLLAEITRMERLRIQINRLILAAREDVPRRVRAMVAKELRTACDMIAAALEEIAREAAHEIRSGADRPPSAAAARVGPALDARVLEVRPQYIQLVGADELVNFAAFDTALRAMGRLIERPLDEPPTNEMAARRGPAPPADPALPRYSAKVALCIVIAYVIALTSQRPELSVILTTVIITALPTYGASLRKMILRTVGSILGGVVTLLAIIVVSPNFETLPSYMIVTFVVLFISGYVSLGSGRVAHAGKQIGTTFLLVFAGLSPSTEIYEPLWRTWGVLLGSIVVTIVFFVFWPEYAGDSLLPRLRGVLRETLQLMPKGAGAASERAIVETISTIVRNLEQILAVADDSRLEGRKSLLDDEAVVQAAGTLRRIANRLGAIALGNITDPLPPLDEEIERHRRALLDAIGERLESWRAFYQGPRCLNRVAAEALAASHPPAAMRESLSEFSRLLEEREFARIAGLTLDQRRTVLNQLQSFRRLELLMSELDQYLSRVPGTEAGSASSSRRAGG